MEHNLEIPEFLKIPAEVRRKAWEENPPKPMPKFDERIQHRSEQEEKAFKDAEQDRLLRKKSKSLRSLAKLKERNDYKPGSYWDTTFSRWVHPNVGEKPTMLSITTNSRGKTPMKTPEEMNGTELVAAYNVLAPRVGEKPVAKFSDLKTGVRRLKELQGKSKQSATATTKKEEKAAPKNDTHERMLFDFDVRKGTNREKVLNKLWENKGKPVNRKELLKAVYGNQSEENVGALNMVFKGLLDKLNKSKLPYTITKAKTEDKEITYAFDGK